MNGKRFLRAAWKVITLAFHYAILIVVWGFVGYVYVPPLLPIRRWLPQWPVARNVDFRSEVMHSSRHGEWSGFECRGAERIGNVGAVAAIASGAG